MNKKLFSLLLIPLCISGLYANPVDETVARKAGEHFAQTALRQTSRSAELRLVKATETYYVYNLGASGFVIVSADDSFRPIVGYSDEGTFPTENPSPEMMYYLNQLSQGRQAALRSNVNTDTMAQQEWNALLKDEQLPSRNGNRVSFYLVQTKWNQNSPYNKFCPKAQGEGRAYAGCVATAMSQVMNYWRYPTHGYGQHSYTYAQYGELSADFSTAVYDFDLMPNSIGDMSPVENIDAIATFMYHCGIAVDMMYGPDGSGAYSYDVPEAVLKYFGYTNRCRYYSRDSYSLEEFQNLLKDQFDMGWPCYYSGQDTDGSGGHAFVCDGYDDRDMFHFNWGWSGSGDGFYVIDELNVSSYAFNDDQGIVANYVPAEVFLHTAKAPENFSAVPNDDMDLSVTLTWTNPTTTLDGHPIESIDQIVILRDNEVIQTYYDLVPGEEISMVDNSGQPVTVNYSVYAVCEGCVGRRAHADGINLGPRCLWTFNLTSDKEEGWGDGAVSIVNSSGFEVTKISPERGETSCQAEIPQGKVFLRWQAPTDTIQVGIEILDAMDQTVFTFNGLSSAMPKGTFFETVNTCGGEGSLLCPSDLQATVEGNDVILNWKGIPDPGYGYIIYRDELLYGMSSDATTFTDKESAYEFHSYSVTAFCLEGETAPTNTAFGLVNDSLAPRNMNAELIENNKVLVTWERPLADTSVSGFTVYRKAIGEEYKRLKICKPSATSFTDYFRVADGNRYFYKVTALNKRASAESTPAPSLHNPNLLYAEINRTHIPRGLTLEEQNGQLLLQWEPTMLAESYKVYCNGELLAQDLTETQFEDTIRNASGLQIYYVTGMLNGVESSPSNKVFYGNYAVGEDDLADVTLFPNPSNGTMTVQAEGLREISVFNLAGQLVLCRKAEGNVHHMDLTSLKPGVYYIKVDTHQGNRVQKVVLL